MNFVLKYISILILLTLLFVCFFYRKPTIRTFPTESSLVVRSPAFGRVMAITRNIKDNTLFIAIFLSPLDIHYQLNPIDGFIDNIKYDPTGKFELAYELNKSNENEKSITSYITKDKKHQLQLFQIAGFVARRIRTYVRPRQQVQKGKIMGLILLGSRVDLLIERADVFETNIQVGQYVNGSDSIIGRWLK